MITQSLPLNHWEDDNEHGFTMVELLVVVLIIGILTSISVPMFLNQRKVAIDARTVVDVKNAGDRAQEFGMIHDDAPITKASLGAEFGTGGELPLSEGTEWIVLAAPDGGVCVMAWNPDGLNFTSSASPATYDSEAGGVNRDKPVACPGGMSTTGEEPNEIAEARDDYASGAAVPYTLTGVASSTWTTAPSEGDTVTVSADFSFDVSHLSATERDAFRAARYHSEGLNIADISASSVASSSRATAEGTASYISLTYTITYSLTEQDIEQGRFNGGTIANPGYLTYMNDAGDIVQADADHVVTLNTAE